jgi:hypothetical protein
VTYEFSFNTPNELQINAGVNKAIQVILNIPRREADLDIDKLTVNGVIESVGCQHKDASGEFQTVGYCKLVAQNDTHNSIKMELFGKQDDQITYEAGSQIVVQI